jgi:hypothetical protein
VIGNRVGVGDHTGAPSVGIGEAQTGTRPGTAAGRPPLGRETRIPSAMLEIKFRSSPPSRAATRGFPVEPPSQAGLKSRTVKGIASANAMEAG